MSAGRSGTERIDRKVYKNILHYYAMCIILDVMKLDTWLDQQGKDVAWLAEKLSAPYQTAYAYAKGKRRPRKAEVIRKITQITNGAVTTDDLLGVSSV